MIIIDTETTGIKPEKDELLQVSIINENGEVLFDSYIRPTHTESWEGAMKVNNITPKMVKDKPTIEEVKKEIQEIIDNSNGIIGYNTRFDVGFLNAAGIKTDKRMIDVMREIGKKYEGGRSRYWKLVDIASKFGFDYTEMDAHNSLTDCLATLFVWNQLTGQISMI